ASQLLYTPPYALHAWEGRGNERLLVFAAAPEDDPVYLEDASLRDAADAVRLDLAGRAATWMLDKLRLITVASTQRLGPYARDATVYVVAGRGRLQATSVHQQQLVRLAAGVSVQVTASSPLTLLVFEPARTTVSSILQEGSKRYSQDDEELII